MSLFNTYVKLGDRGNSLLSFNLSGCTTSNKNSCTVLSNYQNVPHDSFNGNGLNGQPNTGGGGSGSRSGNLGQANGGNGGSGIVIIRYITYELVSAGQSQNISQKSLYSSLVLPPQNINRITLNYSNTFNGSGIPAGVNICSSLIFKEINQPKYIEIKKEGY